MHGARQYLIPQKVSTFNMQVTQIPLPVFIFNSDLVKIEILLSDYKGNSVGVCLVGSPGQH